MCLRQELQKNNEVNNISIKLGHKINLNKMITFQDQLFEYIKFEYLKKCSKRTLFFKGYGLNASSFKKEKVKSTLFFLRCNITTGTKIKTS
jgi:hypothetical protein